MQSMKRIPYTRKKTSHLSRNEWAKLRHDSIGGSDAGAIMGMNKYRSRYELWGIKAGLYEPDTIINERMFCGNLLEAGIFEGAKYWQNDIETTINNYYELEKEVNRIEPANYMIYSKEYPFISANLDGIIKEDSTYPERGDGILEIKTMSGWMHDQYEGGLPPYHYIQLQHYLMVTGFSWGRLFVVVDSNRLFVYDFERNDEIIKDLLEKELEFWGYVEDARKLVGTENEHLIIEPPIDGSESEEDFIRKKFNDTDNGKTEKGSKEQLQSIRKYEEIKEAVKELETKKRKISNSIKLAMKDVAILDFGDNGRVTYKKNVKGIRTFHVNIN